MFLCDLNTGWYVIFKRGQFQWDTFLKAWQADILLFSDPNSPFDHSSQILFSKCQMHIIRHFCKWDCVRNLCHLVNDSFNIFGQVFSMLQLRHNVKNMWRKKKYVQIFMTIRVQYTTTFTSRSQLPGGLFIPNNIQRKIYPIFHFHISTQGGGRRQWPPIFMIWFSYIELVTKNTAD